MRYFQTKHTFVVGHFVDCDVGKINKIDVGFKTVLFRLTAAEPRFKNLSAITENIYKKNSLPLEAEEE